MPIIEVKCFKCDKVLKYNEDSDKKNDELRPQKIRKVVVDENGTIAPLYAIPPDKRSVIGDKFIKFACEKCIDKT